MGPMARVRNLRDELTDDSLRFAILTGLVTIPFTVVRSWEPTSDGGIVLGGSISGGPLLVAGLIVGYRYSGRPVDSGRAGKWTGLVGSIGTVIVYVANTVATVGNLSSTMAIAALVLAPILVAIGVGLTVLGTMIPAMIAGWVTERLDRAGRRPESWDDADRDATGSKWRRLVVAYAVAGPTLLVVVFLADLEADVGFVLSFLGALLLVPLSLVAVVALFIDATDPRDATADWVPNVWLYVGAPIGTYAVVWLVATLRSATYPPGYALYGFVIALCLTSVAYLTNSYRRGGSSLPG